MLITYSRPLDDYVGWKSIENPSRNDTERVLNLMNYVDRRFVFLTSEFGRLILLHDQLERKWFSQARIHIAFLGARSIAHRLLDPTMEMKWYLHMRQSNGEMMYVPLQQTLSKDKAIEVALHFFDNGTLPENQPMT